MRKSKRKNQPPPPQQPEGENKDSCDMRLVTFEDFQRMVWRDPNTPVGIFHWGTSVKEIKGREYRWRTLWHVLPSGDMGCIPIEPIPDPVRPHLMHGNPPKLHSWTWDGNEEKPTLQPSVWLKGRWHGYFRNGRMETC